jgi:hypothetical protein
MEENIKKSKLSTKKTKCFSYKVTMLVHVVANDELKARTELDEKGGMVSDREVELLSSVELYNKIKNESESESK